MRAQEIERRIDRQFGERFEALDRQFAGAASDDAGHQDARAELLLEREKVLVNELVKAGMRVPEGEQLDLEPQTMRLTAGKSAAKRVVEVHELPKKEPPRRTVAGSFRVH